MDIILLIIIILLTYYIFKYINNQYTLDQEIKDRDNIIDIIDDLNNDI